MMNKRKITPVEQSIRDYIAIIMGDTVLSSAANFTDTVIEIDEPWGFASGDKIRLGKGIEDMAEVDKVKYYDGKVHLTDEIGVNLDSGARVAFTPVVFDNDDEEFRPNTPFCSIDLSGQDSIMTAASKVTDEKYADGYKEINTIHYTSTLSVAFFGDAHKRLLGRFEEQMGSDTLKSRASKSLPYDGGPLELNTQVGGGTFDHKSVREYKVNYKVEAQSTAPAKVIEEICGTSNIDGQISNIEVSP